MTFPSKEFYRESMWLGSAVRGECWNIKHLPEENPNRPDSEFFRCLLRICAVVKGTNQAHINKQQAREMVKAAVARRRMGMQEREVERQFNNAWKIAEPRAYRPTLNITGRGPGKALDTKRPQLAADS